ncbi:MAG: 3-isopropylmalate dehydrogenase [Eubacteriales bacterium]|jgi:3-isopropylmalate dehydrogenase
MNKNITVIKGDGIGPEIVTQALRVLDRVAEKFGHTFTYNEVLAGGCAIDACGECLPQSTVDACLSGDSVLLGAVGGPKWDHVPGPQRPEKALLGIRSKMQLYANLRPAVLFPQLAEACPLKPSIVEEGIDFVVVRELTGGIYFGTHKTEEVNGQPVATDIMTYSEEEIERIARVAFDTAMKRRKHVTSVDKANVLDTSRLWRKVVDRVAQEYPEVTVTHMYVDNAAMQLCKKPSQFDVILTENMFGDILSDEASMITGTIGTIGSSSLGATSRGMYEPIHGSAPDIAGQDKANPIGTILAAAMMLRYSFDMPAEADCIEAAVNRVLDAGYRTGDMMSDGMTLVGCRQMGDLVVAQL